MKSNTLAQFNKPACSPNGTVQLEGVILGGGWEHDTFRNPCARVEIILNAHHLTLVDETERGWMLDDFDGAPIADEEFKRIFGVEFGEDAEFDYAALRDFVRTLERVGSERIAEEYRGKTVDLEIEARTANESPDLK
ncbi:MAG: hypothetical protein B6D41_00965 [Chloroflexi bacterium UTCFX4]|jgi:hypothetical protein|nr:MAG: hypothetical protein B6D41_00965 [Chloroflexi bacterium UTCFX4]